MSRTLAALILAACAPACEFHGMIGAVPDGGGDDDGATDAARDGRDPVRPDAAAGDAGAGDTVARLLARVAGCADLRGGLYATDHETGAEIPVCGLGDHVVYWKADLDVDCDGEESAVCNAQRDPAFQNRTSATTSTGAWLDAATLPYVVVPLPSERWSYEDAGLELGAVVAVIYNGRLEFGVFGDQGPAHIIGEASYAMAQRLGIDPDPATGGADGGVIYLAFGGDTLDVIEDHAAAVELGEARVAELLAR